MKVPVYGGGAQTQVTGVATGPRAQAANTQGADAALIGGVQQVGQLLGAVHQRQVDSSTMDAKLGFERAKNDLMFNPDNGYFGTKGRAAYDSAKSTKEQLSKLRQQYVDSLEDPEARREFERVSASSMTGALADIDRHASSGLESWHVSTLQGQQEQAIDNSALYWNQPDTLAQQYEVGRRAVVDAGTLVGKSAAEIQADQKNFSSTFYRGAIGSAALTDVPQAKELLKSHTKLMTSQDLIAARRLIQTAERKQETQRVATESDRRAVLLVDQFEDRADIVKEVDKIKDTRLRDATLSESMRRFSLKRQAEQEKRVDAYNEAEDATLSGNSLSEWVANNPDGWNSLSTKQQQKLQTGAKTATNWETYNKVMLLPDDQLAEVNPSDYIDVLAPSQRRSLLSAIRSARGKGTDPARQIGRSRTAQVSGMVRQLFGAKTTKHDPEQVNAFYSLVDNEVRFREKLKGAPLASDEFTSVLNEVARSHVEKGFLWGTNEDSLKDAPDKLTRNMDLLVETLHANGKFATTDNLYKLYNQLEPQLK